MRLFDSHAHLTDGSFASELPDVLNRASESGVEFIVTIASDLEDSLQAIGLTAVSASPKVWASAGIHPHQADRFSPEALAELETLASSEGVVAIGETGLDFHYENAPRDKQLLAFRAQIEVAERLGLPVVVHSRDASEPVEGLIREYADRVVGVLHCFTGSAQLLTTALESDWYVSFSGIVTFTKYHNHDLVLEVPEDRLLVETDSPYLAPVPVRGRRNEPAFIGHVVRRVAEIRSEDPESIAEATYQNACRFYGVGS